MSVSNDNKRPVDIVMDADGCLRALYADGPLGPALSTDQMLDTLPLLQDSRSRSAYYPRPRRRTGASSLARLTHHGAAGARSSR